MGEGRRRQAGEEWQGLGGRNPLTLAPEVFEAAVEQAAAHIARVGVSQDKRLSLAACWLLGEAMRAEAAGPAQALPAVHPVGLAYVGAVGDKTLLALPAEALAAAGDRWFEALDAAGANDRIRAFTDAVTRLARHDNPHDHPVNQALVIELADRPLALEPLASRLLPAELLGADLPPADAAYLDAPRRTTTSSGTTYRLSDEAAAELAEAGRETWERAQTHGLGPDATLGEVFAAEGISDAEVARRTAAMLEQFDPAYAYAYLATDGLILTEDNRHLVDPADADRWGHAAGAFTTIFEYADVLGRADANEDDELEAHAEAGGNAIDELVACVEDGAMTAWAYLFDRVAAHPASEELFAALDFAAYVALSHGTETADEAPALAAARRLAERRFDAEVATALARVVDSAGGIPEGDALVHREVPDLRRRMAVWSLLLVGVNSAARRRP